MDEKAITKTILENGEIPLKGTQLYLDSGLLYPLESEVISLGGFTRDGITTTSGRLELQTAQGEIVYLRYRSIIKEGKGYVTGMTLFSDNEPALSKIEAILLDNIRQRQSGLTVDSASAKS